MDADDDYVGDGVVGEESFFDGEGEDGSAWNEEFVSLFGRVTKRETIKYSPPIFIISFSLPVICQFPSSS